MAMPYMARRDTTRAARAGLLIAIRGLLVVSLLGGMARAGDGGVQQLPAARVKAKSGLRIKADTRWVGGNGYRPIRVEVSSATRLPAARDRVLRIELRFNGWGRGQGTLRVSQMIELPQGSVSTRQILRVPQGGQLQMMYIDTFEGGRRLDELCGRVNIAANTGRHSWSESTPAVLFIDSDAPTLNLREQLVDSAGQGNKTPFSGRYQLPDVRGLAAAIPGDDYKSAVVRVRTGRLDDQTTLGLLSELQKVEMLPPSELFDQWIDFSCLQIVVVSLPDLAAMNAQRPKMARALRRWVATGQTLCVYDVGADYAKLADLHRLLQLPPPADGDPPAASGWNKPNAKHFGGQVVKSIKLGATRIVNNRRVLQTPRAKSDDKAESDNLLEFTKKPPAIAPFLIRDVQLGRVVAFSAEDPFPGSAQKWCWMLNSVGENNFKWYKQLGVSMHRDNVQFWDWLIPGVGRAPVITFLVLSTLFAIVIGPVNYFSLRRIRRLSLLLVTVPLGAALVTFALFGYALLTDGLGTKARIRSVAMLDQAAGESVSWSRQTYYASIAPSRGLQFPRESLVFSVIGRPTQESGGSSYASNRMMRWRDQQELVRGYLPSRVTSQFVVGHAGPSDAELVVAESAGNGAVAIENLLGTRIEQLLLRTSRGELFHQADIADGARVTLTEAALTEADRDNLSVALMEMYEDNQPRPPDQLDASAYDEAFVFRMFGYTSGTNVDTQEDSPGFKDSLMERNMRKYLAAPETLPAGTYVAIVKQNPLAPLGVRRARQVAGFHVIVGTW